MPSGEKSIYPQVLNLTLNRRNPYNGIVFEKCPVPDLHPIGVLRGPDEFCIDFDVIEMLRTAFAEHSTSYRIEHLTLRAVSGDFILVHNLTGTAVFVELKSRRVSRSKNGDIVHFASNGPRHPPAWKGANKKTTTTSEKVRSYFSATTQWDFLLSIHPDHQDAYFWSRDDLPSSWFGPLSLLPGSTVVWKHPPKEMLDRNHIRWAPEFPQHIVRQMEAVLDHRLPGSLAAQIVRPFVQEALEETGQLLAEEDGFGSNEQIAPILPRTRDDLRGTTSRWSPRNHGYVREAWLRQLCKKGYASTAEGPKPITNRLRRYGAVYDLCGHPVATHAFAGIVWPGDECPSFFDLPPNTPMVYLGFAPVCDLDQVHANDKRRAFPFTGITHGEYPLIYVLTPAQEEAIPDGPRVYVIPSGAIRKTRARHEASEGALSRARGKRVYVPLKFTDTEFIDEFDVKRDETVAWLRHNVFTSSASLQSYLTVQREVSRQYLRVWNGEVNIPLHRTEVEGLIDEV